MSEANYSVAAALVVAQLTWANYLVATALVIVCALLIIIMLLQKGRGGGLSAAFGGGSGSAFGAKTGDVFTWITVAFAALYLILNVAGSFIFRQVVTPPPAVLAPATTTAPATQPTAETPGGPSGVKLEPVELEEVLKHIGPQGPATDQPTDEKDSPATPPPTEQPEQKQQDQPTEDEPEQPSDPEANP